MELHELTRNYAIEMDKDDFNILDNIEFNEIQQRLSNYDVEQIEYKPHFGCYFYFTSTKKNAYLVMAEIGDIIEEEKLYE